jgi:M6 family metalloprotease-like protein
MKGSILACVAYGTTAAASSCLPKHGPFEAIDPQNWVNPDDMIWDDFTAPPGTTWNDASRKGSERNFNIALVVVDYDDMPLVVTGPPNSTIFGNPMPQTANIPRKDVPAHYRDLLNKVTDLNRGHTLHEYWMEDSRGRYGVDLTSFGPYKMPALAYQYGINYMNPGACPENKSCDLSLREDSFAAWRADVGNDTANSFELTFILSAGQDESSTWQEFGEMMFASEDDVPDAFGPPADSGLPNFAKTRYVPWSSWAAASSVWPNAGGGSSIQGESSGMGTYAHELSHLLNIPDNYNNPYGQPPRRSYTGPWSMLSRGSFNGPGGPHSRWHIPALQGGALGSLHTMRDKLQLGLVTNDTTLSVERDTLAKSGSVVARITARSVISDLMGIRIFMDKDLSPACNTTTDLLCDGGNYDAYDFEVVDRMGSDSFQPDSGVMISKIKVAPNPPFQWTIDANPQDIELVDFIRPNGTKAMITMGDYRQLADALFHAGTESGSEFEHIDEANGLHLYVINPHRSAEGVLSYTVGARSLDAADKNDYGVSVKDGKVLKTPKQSPTSGGVFCSFDITNNGTFAGADKVEGTLADHMQSDIYRLSTSTESSGWKVQLPNELATAKFGEKTTVFVAAGASADADDTGVVSLTVTSESDKTAVGTAECKITKDSSHCKLSNPK